MELSRASRALMRSGARLPASQVAVRDPYAPYPDCLIDAGAEQECPIGTELLVWLPPVAAFTGMRWLPPLVLHGAHRATDDEIDAHAALFSARLAAWPSVQGWPELADDEEALPAWAVPADARPAAAAG